MKFIKQFGEFKDREVKKFLSILDKEIENKKQLRNIFIKYAKRLPITLSEREFVRIQVIDILKLLGISALFVIPASTIIIPLLIKMAKKFNYDILPSSMVIESLEEEIVDVIQDNKKVYLKYIYDYPEHNRETAYNVVNIEDDKIEIDVDGKIYYSDIEHIEGIEENFKITKDDVAPRVKSSSWKEDSDYIELLKTHGGVKGVINKIKKAYDISYLCKNEKELYDKLKYDGFI